jgi:hypothetical protein
MPDNSPILALPLIQPSQAQKHVTHNEAVLLLDALLHLAVISRALTTPPATPAEADRYIVASGAVGDWAGQAGRIALRQDGVWRFLVPNPGFRAWVQAESTAAQWNGTAWVTQGEQALSVTQLGVSSSADATNRLAVSSPATLLTHAGAGHQVKVNKAAATDTASLLYQTGFSGRAEMGLTGSDDFTIKVSADGAAWFDAVVADRSTGRARFPGGARVPNGTAAAPALAFDASAGAGLYRAAADQIGLATAGVARALLGTAAFQIDLPLTGTAVVASATDATAGRVLKVGAGWQQLDATLYRPGNILGTVSQTAGVPTGAILQRGTGANGEFARYADGTLICTHSLTGSTSAAVTWTFPSAFIAVPSVTGTAQATVLSCVMLDAAPTVTAATISTRDKADARRADVMRLIAVGRWF